MPTSKRHQQEGAFSAPLKPEMERSLTVNLSFSPQEILDALRQAYPDENIPDHASIKVGRGSRPSDKKKTIVGETESKRAIYASLDCKVHWDKR